jgi:Nickel responsive protein SCO4226-like
MTNINLIHFHFIIISLATEAQSAPRDELEIKTVNILYNLEVGSIYCVLDAPHKEAVEKHHGKVGVRCDLIMEVKTTVITYAMIIFLEGKIIMTVS